MFKDQEDIDFILKTAMQGREIKPILAKFILEDFKERAQIIIGNAHVFEIVKVENETVLILGKFILEDFKEGEKIIIANAHLFEVLKVENATILMKPIGTCLLARDSLNKDKNIITRRYIQNGEIIQTTL